jgi:hypothetical protein
MNLCAAANDSPRSGLKQCAQAMPVRYEAPANAVTAYRTLRRGKQSATEPWTRLPAPRWWVSHAA